MKTPLVPVPMARLRVDIRTASTAIDDGISVGLREDRVVLALTRDGETLYTVLAGNTLDRVAGLLADAIRDATLAAAPSLGSVQ